jgi:hypothetical protein
VILNNQDQVPLGAWRGRPLEFTNPYSDFPGHRLVFEGQARLEVRHRVHPQQAEVVCGIVEDWNIRPDRPWYLLQSTPSDWVKLHSSPFSGDGVAKVAINTNGFTGAIEVACNGSSPCKPVGEAGGVYRTLASGRVLLVSWERESGGNDFSYQKYFRGARRCCYRVDS